MGEVIRAHDSLQKPAARPLYEAFLVKKFKQGGASFFLRQFLYSICKSVSSSRPDFAHASARSSFQLSKLATT